MKGRNRKPAASVIARGTSLIEIERKYLLKSAPPIPAGAEVWRIEQGYLSGDAPAVESQGDSQMSFGRLRRVTHADGSIHHFHTVKAGVGMVRSETERQISPEQFAQHWPRTAGRRLSKVRHRVRDPQSGLVWEIDIFDKPPLVLAEVELPSADTPIAIPTWLQPHILRDVTDDPNYTNAAIASGTSLEEPYA